MKNLLISFLILLTLIVTVPQAVFADEDLPTPPLIEDGGEEDGEGEGEELPPPEEEDPPIRLNWINGPCGDN